MTQLQCLALCYRHANCCPQKPRHQNTLLASWHTAAAAEPDKPSEVLDSQQKKPIPLLRSRTLLQAALLRRSQSGDYNCHAHLKNAEKMKNMTYVRVCCIASRSKVTW